MIKITSLFATSVIACSALISCLPQEQTASERLKKVKQSIENVDDVIDGVKACLGFSLDWDNWMHQMEASGWKKLKSFPRQKISETETGVAVFFVNEKQMIKAHYNFMKLDFAGDAKGIGRCTTFSNLKSLEDAKIAGSKIISTFSVPEFDPPSSSINLKNGESINYSIQDSTKKSVYFATIVNS